MYRLVLLLAIGALTIAPSTLADAPAKATIDPQAMALLQKVQKTMLGLRTYQAECDTTISYPAQDGKPAHELREASTLKAAKPNLMRYDQIYLKLDPASNKWVPNTKDRGITFACNGKKYWQQFGASYRVNDNTAPKYLSTVLEPWKGFYNTADSPRRWVLDNQKEGGLLELRLDGQEDVNGMPCEKVFDHMKVKYAGTTQEYWETWYIGSDGFVRRKASRIDFGGKAGYKSNAVIKNIKINQPIAKTIFAYVPPKGVTLEDSANQEPLLANGTAAPEFTATDKNGKPVSLADFKGKVVVVDFWASWCPPCRASMPHNQEVAKKLQGEGLPVVLLAVDNSEKRDAFDSWVAGNSSKLSALTFAFIAPETDVLGKLYKVTGIPTQYVIYKSGLIRASFVGYGGPSDDLENAVRKALKEP